MIQLVEDAKDWWRMSSMRLQILCIVACTVFLQLEEQAQTNIIGLTGLQGDGVLDAFVFFSKVIVALNGTTMFFRLTKVAPKTEDQQ